MISIFIFLPLLTAFLLFLVPPTYFKAIHWTAIGLGSVQVIFSGLLWLWFEPGEGMQFQQLAPWIPDLGINYHVGLDGVSLPLVAMSTLVFLAVYIYSLGHQERLKEYTILFLLMETTCLGVFAALDLIVFYLFWDLTLIFMFLVILLWGHENRRRAALKFLIYTFLGSLSLLIGIIGLYLMTEARTFDMLEITAANPLAGTGTTGALILLALGIGLAIKTPTFPVHTWLPPAHVEAPAGGSAVLAAIMLKMGTYGFLRIAMPMAPEQWAAYAWVILIIGLISVLYGALVALGQTSFKALVAYTSINHMGYIVMGLGAVGLAGRASEELQTLAISGTVTQMVAHGLVTGMLFLFTGMLYRRTGTYAFDRLGGLSKVAPLLTGFTTVAAVASFGLPGFAHFVAELQIFMGTIGIVSWAGVTALLGVLIIAGTLIYCLQRIFFGPLNQEWRQIKDLQSHELAATLLLTASFTAIGIFPGWMIAVVRPASKTIADIFNAAMQ